LAASAIAEKAIVEAHSGLIVRTNEIIPASLRQKSGKMGKYDPPDNVYKDLAVELKAMLESGQYQRTQITEATIRPMLERHFHKDFMQEAAKVFEEFVKIQTTGEPKRWKGMIVTIPL
jgi:hypothetical protein